MLRLRPRPGRPGHGGDTWRRSGGASPGHFLAGRTGAILQANGTGTVSLVRRRQRPAAGADEQQTARDGEDDDERDDEDQEVHDIPSLADALAWLP